MEQRKSQTEDQKSEFKMTNKIFSETNDEFKTACEIAGVKPTPRQASKWRSRKGRAWDRGRIQVA